MKIVAISDTHCLHRQLEIPDGDVLIHAGDITGRGEKYRLLDFCDWLDSLPHKHKIVIAGNHDFCFENGEHRVEAISTIEDSATYLEDESIVIDGVKFYGSPWQPDFCNWAFNLPRGEALREKWDLIEADTDVLITHGPPLNILDLCPSGHVGDADLREAVQHLSDLKYHIFGHIHESYGIAERLGVTYVNASSCNGAYMPWNKPIVLTSPH